MASIFLPSRSLTELQHLHDRALGYHNRQLIERIAEAAVLVARKSRDKKIELATLTHGGRMAANASIGDM